MTVDLLSVDSTTGDVTAAKGFTPSPVVKIDGVDVVSFLLEQSLTKLEQDPDTLWNSLFYQLGKTASSTFENPSFYTGSETTITFANGTELTNSNIAFVNVNLTGVTTGDDAYQLMCPGAFLNDSTVATATSTESTPATTSAPASTSTIAPAPTISPYPWPVIKHSADSVAGYYLNATGLTDVAVLKVAAFSPANGNLLDYEKEFQAVVQKFLDAAVKSKKKKLIIDLQRNGGESESRLIFFYPWR